MAVPWPDTVIGPEEVTGRAFRSVASPPPVRTRKGTIRDEDRRNLDPHPCRADRHG
jgi:hypothetical protein